MNNDGEIRIGTKIDTSGFEEGAKDLKDKAEKLDGDVSKKFGSGLNRAVTKISDGLSKGISKALNLGSKATSVIGDMLGKTLRFFSTFLSIGALGGILGGLAVGGFILGKALDKANGKSEQLKANLSYIGFVASKIFENLLQPAIDKTTNAVNGLVGVLYKAVVYIGYILSKWTDKDLFKGTSVSDYAKSMEEANKSAKKTAKSTKQIKKDLMGFDEVNKLSENVSSSSGASTPKITTPNLPNLGEIQIPKWVQWIADNKDLLLKVFGLIMSVLTFSKVVKWLSPLESFLGTAVGKIGIILASLTAIYKMYEKIIADNKKQAEQVEKIGQQGTKYAEEEAKKIKNTSEAIEKVNQKRKAGNELSKKALSTDAQITGTQKALGKNLIQNAKQQDIFLQTQIKLMNAGKLSKEDQEKLLKTIKEQIPVLREQASTVEATGNNADYIYGLLKQYEGILENHDVKYRNILEDHMNIYQKAKDTKNVLDGTSGSLDNANNKTKILKDNTKAWEGAVGGAQKGILSFNKTKLDDKKLNINVEANTSKANRTLSDFIKGIGTKLSDAFKKIDLSGLGKKITDGLKKLIPDIKLPSLSSIKKIFAREGGIINVPGKGVPIGTNVIGGEAGPEAILPLNDKTLDRLGSSIARHMNINLTNVTQMNGRTISRELKQIMNESEFTYNG